MKRRLLAGAALVAALGIAGGTGAAVAGNFSKPVVTVNPPPFDLSTTPPTMVDTTTTLLQCSAVVTVRRTGYFFLDDLADAPGSRVETFTGSIRFSAGKHASVTLSADYEAHQYNDGSPDSNNTTIVGAGPIPASPFDTPYEDPGRTWVVGRSTTYNEPVPPTLTGTTTDICTALGLRDGLSR
jgi:hypothetical protein